MFVIILLYTKEKNIKKETSMKKVAIFASGSGTNAGNIIRYFADSTDIRISVVLSNKKDAGVLERAKALGVPSFTFSSADFKEGTVILSKLKEYNIDFIVLAGFLVKVSSVIIDSYEEKIINIHPALLPKYGGKGMYGHHVHEAVVAAKETTTGITIHFVNERYDEGAVIFQASFSILDTDTVEDIEKKIHELEYKHFPLVIEELLSLTEKQRR